MFTTRNTLILFTASSSTLLPILACSSDLNEVDRERAHSAHVMPRL